MQEACCLGEYWRGETQTQIISSMGKEDDGGGMIRRR